MQRFKEYINEAFGRKTIDEIVFNEPDFGNPRVDATGREVSLPVSRTIAKRLFGIKKRVTAAHLTEPKYVQGVKRMQGRQKALPCMTDPKTSRTWAEGVATDGGVVLIVEGYPVFTSNFDLHSKIDVQGRRFIPLQYLLPTTSFHEMTNKLWLMLTDTLGDMLKQVEKARAQIVYEVLFDRKAGELTPDQEALLGRKETLSTPSPFVLLGNKLVFGGKIKAYAIKRWFDLMESMVWKPYIRRFETLLDPAHLGTARGSWNEINLVDIEIKECYVTVDADIGTFAGVSMFGSEVGLNSDGTKMHGIDVAGYIKMTGEAPTSDARNTFAEITKKVTLLK